MVKNRYIIIGIILSILIHLSPMIYFLLSKPVPPPPPPIKDLAIRLIPKLDDYKPLTLSDPGNHSSSTKEMDCSKNLGNSIYIGIGILHTGGTVIMIIDAPEGYPAYRAGLRKGDIIISMDKRSEQGYFNIVISGEPNKFYRIKTEEICYSGS